jgi:hypothetical protein
MISLPELLRRFRRVWVPPGAALSRVAPPVDVSARLRSEVQSVLQAIGDLQQRASAASCSAARPTTCWSSPRCRSSSSRRWPDIVRDPRLVYRQTKRWRVAGSWHTSAANNVSRSMLNKADAQGLWVSQLASGAVASQDPRPLLALGILRRIAHRSEVVLASNRRVIK